MLAAALLAGLVALSASPASAAREDGIPLSREEWRVIGWDDACGVAFTVLQYPKLGAAIASEPVATRVGTMSIPVGSQNFDLRWVLEADGPLSFSQKALDKAEADLRKGGYSRPGFPEVIQEAVGDQPELAHKILSTDTLAPRLKSGWPGPEWRWAAANYNPLATCALLVYEDHETPVGHSFLLVRVYNPRTRTDRAYAHASNARLLLDEGDLAAGVVEADTAARLDPRLPIARYENAAMLALSGRMNAAVTELAEAVKLDKKYAAKARDDIDFIDLRSRDDFKEIVH